MAIALHEDIWGFLCSEWQGRHLNKSQCRRSKITSLPSRRILYEEDQNCSDVQVLHSPMFNSNTDNLVCMLTLWLTWTSAQTICFLCSHVQDNMLLAINPFHYFWKCPCAANQLIVAIWNCFQLSLKKSLRNICSILAMEKNLASY